MRGQKSVTYYLNGMKMIYDEQVGPHRDVVGEFEEAVRKSRKLHFGLYHSLFEWFNPMYHNDVANNFTTRHYAANKVS